jgi:hypothetical protein
MGGALVGASGSLDADFGGAVVYGPDAGEGEVQLLFAAGRDVRGVFGRDAKEQTVVFSSVERPVDGVGAQLFGDGFRLRGEGELFGDELGSDPARLPLASQMWPRSASTPSERSIMAVARWFRASHRPSST